MTQLSRDTQTATAAYIKGMLTELRAMGQAIEGDFLVYLIEMAMVEASDIATAKQIQGREYHKVMLKPSTPSAEELAALYMAGKLES